MSWVGGSFATAESFFIPAGPVQPEQDRLIARVRGPSRVRAAFPESGKPRESLWGRDQRAELEECAACASSVEAGRFMPSLG